MTLYFRDTLLWFWSKCWRSTCTYVYTLQALASNDSPVWKLGFLQLTQIQRCVCVCLCVCVHMCVCSSKIFCMRKLCGLMTQHRTNQQIRILHGKQKPMYSVVSIGRAQGFGETLVSQSDQSALHTRQQLTSVNVYFYSSTHTLNVLIPIGSFSSLLITQTDRFDQHCTRLFHSGRLCRWPSPSL